MLGEGDMNGGQKEVVGVLAATAAKKGPARLEQGVAQFVLALQNTSQFGTIFNVF